MLDLKIYHVYGLNYADGKFTADAARECDSKILNKVLEDFKPTHLNQDIPGLERLPITTKPLAFGKSFDLDRIEKNRHGIVVASGKYFQRNESDPSTVSKTWQVHPASLVDEEKGILVIIAEVEARNAAIARESK